MKLQRERVHKQKDPTNGYNEEYTSYAQNVSLSMQSILAFTSYYKGTMKKALPSLWTRC